MSILSYLFLLIGLDQLLKWGVVYGFVPMVECASFLRIERHFNYGGLFGVGAGLLSPYFYLIIGSLVTAMLIWQVTRKRIHGLHVWSEIFLLAGVLSNVFDRFMWGAVVDFIVFKLPFVIFPVFNFADCYITIGIIGALMESAYEI